MAVAGILTALVVFLQYQIDPLRRQPAIEPPNAKRALGGVGNSGAVLPFEYTLGAVSGFRQVIAGLLWVRADSFFHSGNYDAILPLVRLITWLDPNFLDVYSTGAWHLMYNFTDTDQRSDRRYLPAGMALLREGIANNPDLYDMYAEAGWNSFDKIKDYKASVDYYSRGMKTRNADITRVGHALAHSLERSGDVDAAIEQWRRNVEMHKKFIDDPKANATEKARHGQGYESSAKNLRALQFRKANRRTDTQPPVDLQFSAQVIRLRPKVLEVRGSWNLVGAKSYDAGEGSNFGAGITVGGPVDGARVDVRLQDAGYAIPTPNEFSFEVDDTLTIMQDQLSTRGGKQVRKGGLYVLADVNTSVVDRNVDKTGVYPFTKEDLPPNFGGIPIRQALAQGGGVLSEEGRKQVAAAARMPFEQARSDAATLARLEKEGFHVATRDLMRLGTYGREIDMSKDPKMYSFTKDKYELIIGFNPRYAPDFVQDRLGWSGEGLTDKRYLDTKTIPGVRMIRRVITLSKEDILGEGRKVLAE